MLCVIHTFKDEICDLVVNLKIRISTLQIEVVEMRWKREAIIMGNVGEEKKQYERGF